MRWICMHAKPRERAHESSSAATIDVQTLAASRHLARHARWLVLRRLPFKSQRPFQHRRLATRVGDDGPRGDNPYSRRRVVVVEGSAKSQQRAATLGDTEGMDQHTQDQERATLTATDFAAAGVDAPNWTSDPVPSLETWRRWRAAEDQALAFVRAQKQATR